MQVVMSHNGIPIRLTDERWMHIVENHDELAGKREAVLEAVADPDVILEGSEGELLATRFGEQYAVVTVYKEISATDGFVITAFETSRAQQLTHSRKILWSKQQ